MRELLSELPVLRGGSCRGLDRAHLWDEAVDGEHPVERDARHAEARRICAGCPVRAECLAMRTFEAGIWAGELFQLGSANPRGSPTRPADGLCDCGQPVHPGRVSTCSDACLRARGEQRKRELRLAQVAAEVARVLDGGPADGLRFETRARLVDHYTAVGRDARWIAGRLGVSTRAVERRIAATRSARTGEAVAS